MFFSPDMKDLLEIFERNGVRYVVVGGHAVNYYGYIRTTQDIDLLIYPSVENAQKMIRALDEFGFGEAGISQVYFEEPGSAIHLGVEPNRIDLLTHLKGVDNDQIFTNMKRVGLEDISVNMISLQDLIEVKRRSDRPRDRADAEELERTENGNSE